jgi:hypothetical protein
MSDNIGPIDGPFSAGWIDVQGGQCPGVFGPDGTHLYGTPDEKTAKYQVRILNEAIFQTRFSPTPTPGDLDGPKGDPYKVEVDDHSDDCGTVYALRGPNVSILSKDEDELKERAADFNLGFERGFIDGRTQPATSQVDLDWPKEMEFHKKTIELLKAAWIEWATNKQGQTVEAEEVKELKDLIATLFHTYPRRFRWRK